MGVAVAGTVVHGTAVKIPARGAGSPPSSRWVGGGATAVPPVPSTTDVSVPPLCDVSASARGAFRFTAAGWAGKWLSGLGAVVRAGETKPSSSGTVVSPGGEVSCLGGMESGAKNQSYRRKWSSSLTTITTLESVMALITCRLPDPIISTTEEKKEKETK